MGEALQLTRPPGRPERPRRIPLDGVVRIRCEGRNGLHTGFVRDLSRTGMFVRILDPELPGRQVDFELDLDLAGGPRRITGRGEVAWCRSAYEGPARPPGMGLQFLHLEAEGRRLLGELFGEGAEGSEIDDPLIDPLVPPAEAWRRGRKGGQGGPIPEVGRGRRRWWAGSLVVPAAVLGGVLVLLERPPVPLETGKAAAEQPLLVIGNGADSPAASTRLPAAEPPATADRSVDDDTRPEMARPPTEPEPALPPMTRLTTISWEIGPALTVLTLEGDGPIDPSRIRSSGIGGEHPRRLLELRGVSGEIGRHEVSSPEVLRVRTGFHPRGEGELHVVLDLAAPGVTVSPPELLERGLRLTLASAPGAAGAD